MKKIIAFLLLFALWGNCGEKNAPQPPTHQELNEVKKLADSALAQIDALKNALPKIEGAQNEIIKYQQFLYLLLSDPTASRLDDAEVQLAYLTEAFRDLYSQVKDIRLIPFIQQAQKTAPRPSGFTVSTATATLGGDEYSLYSRGLDAYRKKFYDEARQFMLEVTKSFPNGIYGDRANYWIAESFVEQKSFKQALEYYQKVLNFGGSSKEDDAQYRIGVCYLYLGEFDKAVEELTKLVRRYPASEFVAKANDAIEIARRKKAAPDDKMPSPDVISPAQGQNQPAPQANSQQSDAAAQQNGAPAKHNDKHGAKDKEKKQ